MALFYPFLYKIAPIFVQNWILLPPILYRQRALKTLNLAFSPVSIPFPKVSIESPPFRILKALFLALIRVTL